MYRITSTYATVVKDIEAKNDSEKYYVPHRGAVLTEKHYTAKNSVNKALSSSVFCSTVKNAFKDWNTCAAFCTIEISKTNNDKAIGLSLDGYDDYVIMDNRGNTVTLLGVVVMQDNGPMFIPLKPFGLEYRSSDYDLVNCNVFV